ncbi:undecaprenyl-diphosphatase [Enterococcus pallens]|uniref:Phosphatidic acid phosphatase type 2/haloperoxidase domain-containing protein n=1 Tax=Enterococcus pallens ATCC BAA-351 TaxID=1158607 RepID=R2SYW0_9ENTE|nr:undecaprenyl-diphosphatase [Enterococcus pallens]EOH93229.1 hypothetical protein UAU_02872 [Enterococcus pallens ATCC BAA-351]EOU25015.1 hypothetical protein I588_01003 [Enterococcus pallens ATCC BAA-351]OJG76110.1 hypothetical protein RV10_GL004220 [Enterococcus pallens]
METIDNQAFYFINHFAGHIHSIDLIFVDVAKYSPLLLGIYLIWLFFFDKSQPNTRKNVFLALLSFVLAEAIAKVAGLFYAHPQPFVSLKHVHQLIGHSIDNAFPSDHTLLFFSILGFLFFQHQTRYRWGYLVIAAIVGVSRIWVGVHYPIDVLGAALIGMLSGYLLFYWNRRNGKWLLRMDNRVKHIIH